MARLRMSREEAKAEAVRLATELVAQSPYVESHRFYSANPDRFSSKNDSGKTPAIWSVIFTWHIPGSAVDGGELFVRVNVQDKTATFYDFWGEPVVE